MPASKKSARSTGAKKSAPRESAPKSAPKPKPTPAPEAEAPETAGNGLASPLLPVLYDLVSLVHREPPTDFETLRETLEAPFPSEDIEWKPQTVKNGKALAVAYVTNRAIMARLDEAFGLGGWQNVYKAGPDGGVLCGIRFRVVQPNGLPEWLTRWDGADNTKIEPTKGGLSDSMKRAGVQLGIGRYLYRVPSQWIPVDDRNRFTRRPEIPPAFLPQPKGEKKKRDDPERERAERAFHATGIEYTGSQDAWNEKRPELVEWAANRAGFETENRSTNELTTEIIRKLTEMMKEKIRERNEPPVEEEAPRRRSPGETRARRDAEPVEEPEDDGEPEYHFDEDPPW